MSLQFEISMEIPSQNIIIPLGIVPCISVACNIIENALQVTSLVIQFDHTGFRFMTSYQMLFRRALILGLFFIISYV